ncbi:hypothetical protein GCM10009624_09520 [Gordonia sinesedis]
MSGGTGADAGLGDRVRDIVAAMAPAPPPPPGPLPDDARLREDLAFESVRLIELTMVLEQAFSLPPMPPEELAGVLRVGDVIALIARHTDASPTGGGPS